MKKKISLLLVVVLVTLSFVSGVYASETISAITAYINKGLTVQVNGTLLEPKENDGSRIYPIVYNGRTYVLASAVAQALGATVNYDSTGNGKLIITSTSGSTGVPTKEGTPNNAGMPTKEGSPVNAPSTPASSSGSVVNTSSTGTLTSPVPMNERFSWTVNYSYGGVAYSGTYFCVVKSVQAITRDGIANLGFQRPEEDSRVDYVIATVGMEVKDAKLINAEANYPYKYLSSWKPYFAGSETPEGNYVIGAQDYGFDGSLDKAISAVTGFKQINIGESGSFIAEGKVIIPIYKGKTNYMVIRKDGEDDYQKSKLYFKLQ